MVQVCPLEVAQASSPVAIASPKALRLGLVAQCTPRTVCEITLLFLMSVLSCSLVKTDKENKVLVVSLEFLVSTSFY